MTSIKLNGHLLPPQIIVPNIANTTIENGYLKIIQPSDVDSNYVDGINNPEVSRWLISADRRKLSKDDIVSYVNTNNNDPDSLLLGFYLGGKLRGTSRLHNTTQKCADVGVAVFDVNIWGKSWAASVIVSLCDIAHERFNITSFKAGIDVNNIASIKAFSKAGFERNSNEILQYKFGTALLMFKHFLND